MTQQQIDLIKKKIASLDRDAAAVALTLLDDNIRIRMGILKAVSNGKDRGWGCDHKMCDELRDLIS